MNLSDYIRSLPRKTPVRLWLWLRREVEFPGCRVFRGGEGCMLVLGEWAQIEPVFTANREQILDHFLECDRRHSAVALLPIHDLAARIEPGAILREGVQIGKNAVIMMGAILNIGAQVGENSMIDMGAILGARAQVGKNCHIGAGAVLAGVLEPPSGVPVVVEDQVLVGANAVILEGVRIGAHAVVAAGAVVTENIPQNAVAAGCPARVIKYRDPKTDAKTGLDMSLREMPPEGRFPLA